MGKEVKALRSLSQIIGGVVGGGILGKCIGGGVGIVGTVIGATGAPVWMAGAVIGGLVTGAYQLGKPRKNR